MKQTVLAATALVSIGIGISGAIGSNNQLIPILSLVIGSVIGELLHIESGVERIGGWLQSRFGKLNSITEGFVSASPGVRRGRAGRHGRAGQRPEKRPQHPLRQVRHRLLRRCGLLPAPWASAWPSPACPSLRWRGVVALLASLLVNVLSDAVVTEITVTGSLLIIGIGLNVLGLTKLRILNMTPALLIPILLCQFM